MPLPWVAVLVRLFPVGRGLYEDKVASIWCAVDPILKLKAWPHKGHVVLVACVLAGFPLGRRLCGSGHGLLFVLSPPPPQPHRPNTYRYAHTRAPSLTHHLAPTWSPSPPFIAVLRLIATVVLLLPVLGAALLRPPHPASLVWSVFVSSMAFFLASYHGDASGVARFHGGIVRSLTALVPPSMPASLTFSKPPPALLASRWTPPCTPYSLCSA